MVQNIPKLQRKHFRNCELFEDRRQMLSLVPKSGIGVEIGVFRGDFSEVLLRDLEPEQLVLIDIAYARDPRERFAAQVSNGQVVVIEGDSATELSKFPDQYFDWIYIDGDHSHEGVSRDVAAATQKIKSDGCLMFNDYKMGDHNCSAGFFEYGIIHAANRLCINEGWELRGFAFHFQMFCDVLLKRRMTTD